MTNKVTPQGNWSFAYDQAAQLTQITDSQGVVTSYGSDPFGRRLWKASGGVTALAQLRPVRGWHRYYDPVPGRYVTEDALEGDENRYAYSSGNPLRYADPLGYLIWNQEIDAFLPLYTGKLVPYPGSGPAKIGSSIWAATTMKWSIDAICTCEYGKYKLSNITVNYSVEVRRREDLSAANYAVAWNDEMQHVADFAGKGSRRLQKQAKAYEDRQKNELFCTQAECESAARDGMQSILQRNAAAIQNDSRNKYDGPGGPHHH